jgi:RNA polymerase sigma-70 factor (ECF subfamily)
MDEQRKTEFESLLHEHRGIVFKVANTYCWQTEDRAELAQEIALQLWRAWPGFDRSRVFTTWMYRIALNVAISFVRKEAMRRGRSVSFDATLHDTPSLNTEEPDARELRLHRFIERQPPLDRALLLLYLDDRPQREIAEILGLTPTNVSTKINRLKQRIRTEL